MLWLRRVGQALKPGGAVLVCETIPDEARRERVQPLLFALNMQLRTSDGNAFTLPELRSWLREAGLARVISFEAGARSPLVLALKPRTIRSIPERRPSERTTTDQTTTSTSASGKSRK